MNLKKQKYKSIAFAKHTPTVFIVDSPFQVLCAIEAIKEFVIDDYLLVLPIDGNERKEQMLQMVNNEHLVNQVVPSYDTDVILGDLFTNSGIFAATLPKYFERIVIGDYFAIDQWALAYLYALPNATVFYMDDGSASIDLLQGREVKDEPAYWYLKYKWRKTDYLPTMAMRRRIKDKWKEKTICAHDCIYTIYSDLNKNRFGIYPNDFSYLKARLSEARGDKSIYVVGTYSIAYSQSMGISCRQYEGILWHKLSEIRDAYPDMKIIYIPHGRDDNAATRLFCDALHIQYKHLDCAVEYYFVKEKVSPQMIYGFGSTALFSLKKMIPEVTVINWLIDNPNAPSSVTYKNMALYYQKHEIITDRIPFPPLPFRKRITRIIKMLLSEYRGHKNNK